MLKKVILVIICLSVFVTAVYAVTPVVYIAVKNASDLINYVDKKVVVEGKVSDKPWQHIIYYSSKYTVASYFDIGKDQIVIYSKEMIGTTKKIKVKGTVIKVTAKSKNPNLSKAGKIYAEYHILADKIEQVK